MTRRTATCGFVFLICCWVAYPVTAQSNPSIEGPVHGVEICPQSICGAATFVGVYAGQIGNKPAFGFWLLAVRHDEYSPPDQILPPPGKSVLILGGSWRMNVIVLDWWRLLRVSFAGSVQPGMLTHQGQVGDDPPSLLFDVDSALDLLSGGSGTVALEDTVLNENTFPPTISGVLK